MARTPTENLLLSLAGEHAVASQRSLRGYIASMTLKKFPGVDLFYTSPSTGRTESIQVKTTEESWVRLPKEPKARITILVDFAGWDKSKEPDFHIMPSKAAHELGLKDRHYHTEESAKKRREINEEKWPTAVNLLKGDYWEGLEAELKKYKSNWGSLGQALGD